MKRIIAVFIFIIISFSVKAQRPDLPGQLIFDFGFNSWTSTPEGAELDWFESKTVNAAYFFDLPIGNGGWTFTPGVGMGWENYSFSNNSTIVPNLNTTTGARGVEFVDLNDEFGQNLSFNKSKLGLYYVDVPLEIRWYAKRNQYSRGFRVAVGGKVGYNYSSFTKLKFEDALDDRQMVKNRNNLNINNFRYSVHTRLGWGGFGVFFSYELSDKWKTPPTGGENTSTLTWGISITAF